MNRRTWALFLTIGALSASTLAACGNDDASTSQSGAPSGPALTGTPIKIGYAASLSGPQAQNGLDGKGVAHAWQEYTNANGGILGHPVKVEVVDTKNSLPGAVSTIKRFQSDDSFDAIMLTDLVADTQLSSTVKGTDIAVLSGGGSGDQLWATTPGAFQNVSGGEYVQKAYAKAAQAGGAKSYAVLACEEVASCASNAQGSLDYGEGLGMKAGGVGTISASATDYTAQCLSLQGKKVDAIGMLLGYTTATRLMTNCIQQGYEGLFSAANSGFDQKAFGSISGAKVVGSTQGFPWYVDDANVKIYVDAMKRYSSDAGYQSGNSTAIWSTLQLLKKAVEDAKPAEIDRTTVMDALYQVKDETLDGLLPQPTTFTKGQASPPVTCSWLFTFNAGDDDPTAIAPESAPGNKADGDLGSTCLK
jgi:branched-chain amino acid transport system substrate-binding protein